MNTQNERADDLLTTLKNIRDLAEGWDKSGPTGPKAPFRWKTVALMALDYARAAVERVEGWRCPDHKTLPLAEDGVYHLCEECNSWWWGYTTFKGTPEEHRAAVAKQRVQ